ncbi:MAG: trigger factor [Treponema sp.]|nr:trigger factor [Treponema sp.]
MTVSKEITRLEHSELKMTVKVGKDDIRSEYDELVSDYSKNIQIPGFRKGKVPREVLIRKYADSLKGEVLGKIIEKAMGSVFEDETFPKEDRPLPYSTPRLEDDPVLDLETDLTFSVVYDVLPQFTLGQWKGLEVEVPDAELADEDLNRELEAVRERNAIVLDKDDEAEAAKGDVVTVNYCELTGAGEPLAGTEREDFVFTLGSENNLYRFDDELIRMKKGESRDIEKTYGEDFENADLAGKTKKIRVTLTALKERQLPDLDDDLAQDVDEKFKTLEDLKASIRERLAKNLNRRLRDITINKLLEKIMEKTPVDIPESMIRIELDSRWRNLARRLNMPAENLAKMMANSGEGAESLQEGWRPEAIRALHSRLIVESLIQDQNWEVTDADVEKEYETMAADSAISLEELKKYYEQENMKEFLKEEIKERRLFDLLIAENTIKTGKKENYLDLVENNG